MYLLALLVGVFRVLSGEMLPSGSLTALAADRKSVV